MTSCVFVFKGVPYLQKGAPRMAGYVRTSKSKNLFCSRFDGTIRSNLYIKTFPALKNSAKKSVKNWNIKQIIISPEKKRNLKQHPGYGFICIGNQIFPEKQTSKYKKQCKNLITRTGNVLRCSFYSSTL